MDPERAKSVKAAFQYFLKYETLSKTAKKLNEDGVELNRCMQGGGGWPRLDFFTVGNLHNILTNKAYKGVRAYRDGDQEHEVKAVWEGLVSSDQFDRVQEILNQNRSKKKPFTIQRYPYILSGLTLCAHCKNIMCGKSAHGKRRKYGYYEHSWASKKGSTLTAPILKCNPHRVPAEKLEKIVLNHLRRFAKDPGLVQKILEKAQQIHDQSGDHQEVRRLQLQVSGYSRNLEALTERLGELPKDVSASLIFKQMSKLEAAKKVAQERLDELKNGYVGLQELPVDFQSYQSFLELANKVLGEGGDPEVQAKIIKRLVHKIEIGMDKVKIHYYAGQYSLGEVVDSPIATPDTKKNQKSKDSRQDSEFFKDKCSSTLINGAPLSMP